MTRIATFQCDLCVLVGVSVLCDTFQAEASACSENVTRLKHMQQTHTCIFACKGAHRVITYLEIFSVESVKTDEAP